MRAQQAAPLHFSPRTTACLYRGWDLEDVQECTDGGERVSRAWVGWLMVEFRHFCDWRAVAMRVIRTRESQKRENGARRIYLSFGER